MEGSQEEAQARYRQDNELSFGLQNGSYVETQVLSSTFQSGCNSPGGVTRVTSVAIPVSDESGYEHIGGWEYGRGNRLNVAGEVERKTVEALMSPEEMAEGASIPFRGGANAASQDTRNRSSGCTLNLRDIGATLGPRITGKNRIHSAQVSPEDSPDAAAEQAANDPVNYRLG
jgi:hypothetical protein